MMDRRTFMAGASALAAARPAAAAVPPDDFLTFFDILALSWRGRRNGRVRKWTEPVRVRTRGISAAAHRDTIDAMLEEASVLCGLPFERLSAGAKRDKIVTLYFVTGREMRRLFPSQNAVCFAHTEGNWGKLHTARVHIGAEHADCLHHEFMHALGFDGHWPGAETGINAPTALARRSAPERAHGFSAWDKRAIRLLYDPRLSPGMTRNHALSAAQAILDEQG